MLRSILGMPSEICAKGPCYVHLETDSVTGMGTDSLGSVITEMKRRLGSTLRLVFTSQMIPPDYSAVLIDASFLVAYQALFLEKLPLRAKSKGAGSLDTRGVNRKVAHSYRYDRSTVEDELRRSQEASLRITPNSQIESISLKDAASLTQVVPLMGSTPLDLIFQTAQSLRRQTAALEPSDVIEANQEAIDKADDAGLESLSPYGSKHQSQKRHQIVINMEPEKETTTPDGADSLQCSSLWNNGGSIDLRSHDAPNSPLGRAEGKRDQFSPSIDNLDLC